MTTIIDPRNFQELAELKPSSVCARSGCTWDASDASYQLRVWDGDYRISPAHRLIEPLDTQQPVPHEYFCLFILHYLLSAKPIETAGKWISEKDIPSGATFFRGPHAVPTDKITRRFENDLQAFSRHCESLQGKALDLADAAYAFQITPKIPVAALYFEGDEDFPPEAKLLFDASISQHLALDVVFALVVAVCDRLGA